MITFWKDTDENMRKAMERFDGMTSRYYVMSVSLYSSEGNEYECDYGGDEKPNLDKFAEADYKEFFEGNTDRPKDDIIKEIKEGYIVIDTKKSRYGAQDRWREKNIRQLSFSLNRNSDAELIEFVEKNKKTYGIGNLMREAIKLLMQDMGKTDPAYFRRIYLNGDKIELYNKDFKLLQVVDVIVVNGELLLKSTKMPITEGLTQVAKRGDVSTALRHTKPINDDWVELGDLIEMSDEEIRNIHKNLGIK